MKKLLIFPLVVALALVASCQKQQSEEERKAEVERLVQERLAAEHQADEKQRLAQQQADLEAREKALVDREAAAVAAKTPVEPPIEAPQTVRQTRDISEIRSTASYGTFYQKLEPYGVWRETSDYGYVWQPREAEVSRDWRPYTDGRWVYTDAGWTWVSEEAFGWATYHYGRWVRLRRVGWVWVPGEEWAPAWVSWRTGKDYVGWAPLPPEALFDRTRGIRSWADNYYDIGPDQYAFVPDNEFGSPRIQHWVIPVERNVTIVIETTNVTNISYTNTTIINLGPNYQQMRSRSQQPIERYRLERQANAEVSAPPSVRGDVLVISAPAITTVKGVDRPRVKETIAQATVEKSWAVNDDRSASDRAREKMKAEVMPPSDPPSKTFVKPAPSSTSSTTTTATATPASASPVIAPAKTVAATPTPASTVRATPAAITTPTARATASPVSTPSVSRSPRPSATPGRTPQPTPRRLLPTLLVAPTPRASSTQPPKTIAPPPHNSAPKLLPSPHVPKPSPVVTPPVKVMPKSSPPPPNEIKPIGRPTPTGVRPRPPVVVPATPASRAEPSPTPKDKKTKSKGVPGAGKMEDTEPMPIPKSTPK